MSTPASTLEMPDSLRDIADRVQAGNVAGARQATDAFLQSSPDNYAALQLAGVIAIDENRYQDAIELFHRAVKLAPNKSNEGMSWNGAGQAMLGQQQYVRAEEAFRRALQADPACMTHSLDFAQTLADTGKLDLAEEVLRTAMRRDPRDPSPCARLASIWIKNGRQQDALVMLDMAKRIDPNYAPAYFNASVALAMLGKTEAAYAACNAALMLDPSLVGYYQLASLGPVSDEQCQMLKQRTAEDSPDTVNARIDAGFALAILHGQRQEFDTAFQYLAAANRLKRSTISFSRSDSIERIRRLQAFFTRDLLQRFEGKMHSGLKPIFIVGMPRSGSTLVEQMLAAHPQVQAGGELLHLPNICQAVGETWGNRGAASPGTDEEVIADLSRASDEYANRTTMVRRRRERFTDKLPGNYLMLGMIQLMFPEAAIIHTRRDPFDTCLSCYEHLFTARLDYTYDLQDLGAEYRLYEEIMAHWHKVLPPGRILDVDYDAVVGDPEAQVRRILAHCQLPYEAACLDFQSVRRPVTTASATQVRKPIYQSSIGRWRHYRDHLQPLAAALGRPLPE